MSWVNMAASAAIIGVIGLIGALLTCCAMPKAVKGGLLTALLGGTIAAAVCSHTCHWGYSFMQVYLIPAAVGSVLAVVALCLILPVAASVKNAESELVKDTNAGDKTPIAS